MGELPAFSNFSAFNSFDSNSDKYVPYAAGAGTILVRWTLEFNHFGCFNVSEFIHYSSRTRHSNSRSSSCGSITGAPKIRAMEIIDELEPVARGPYTGCAGYLGFNRESQLSILIRTALLREGTAWYHAGAGIVDDSDPAAEYEETLAKAAGFVDILALPAAR